MREGIGTYSKRSLHGRIAHEIAVRIMRGEYAPGDILPSEADFVEALAVSRTALREAKKVLAAKGLVDARPKLGTRVRPREHWHLLDPDVLAWQVAATPVARFVRDLFEMRRIIEPAAAALAAERASADDIAAIETAYAEMEAASADTESILAPDIRFHQAILLASNNELLAPLAALIAAALQTSIRISGAAPGGWEEAIPLHGAVLAAIRRHDPDGARQTMHRLLDTTRAHLRHSLDEDSDGGG